MTRTSLHEKEDLGRLSRLGTTIMGSAMTKREGFRGQTSCRITHNEMVPKHSKQQSWFSGLTDGATSFSILPPVCPLCLGPASKSSSREGGNV